MRIQDYFQVRGTYIGGKIWIDVWDMHQNKWIMEKEFCYNPDAPLEEWDKLVQSNIEDIFKESLKYFMERDLG